MKLRMGSTIGSRFGKRLFTIFIVSAILPILTLGILTFNRVTEQLLEQNRFAQRQEVRTIGLAVYERLAVLESELELVASRLEVDPDYFTSPNSDSVRERISGKLDNLGWYDDLRGYTSLLSGPNQGLALEAIDEASFSATNFTLVTIVDATGTYRIFMVQSRGAALSDRGLLIAQLNPDFLWNTEIISINQNLCTLDQFGNLLFCSQDSSQLLIDRYAEFRASGSFSGNFDWDNEAGETFLTAHWRVFMRNDYGVDDWTVLISVSRQEVLRPITDFQTTFTLIFILSVLIVFMLSSRQIRHILVPLEKLTAATQALGESDFDTRVVIDSRDEFADLADSFNTMGRKLRDQFHSLETMAEIDRLILSSQDSEDIVQTVLLRIQDIVGCDHIGMVVQDADGNFTRQFIRTRTQPDQVRDFVPLRDRRPDLEEARQEEHEASQEDEQEAGSAPQPALIEGLETIESEIELTHEDFQFLEANPEGLLIQLDQHVPDLLEQWRQIGANACLVLPLFIDEIMSAIVILGYQQAPENTEELLPQTRNWADRVAVALSNAKWQEKLYHQANYDALTGLPNRPAFRTYLQQALNRAERNREMVGVLFIDLDRFKMVNDSLGHVVGDDFLKAISNRISKCVRASDMVARLGGDEFVIVVAEDAQYQHIKTSISAVADKLLEAIPQPLPLEGQDISASASIGIAIYPLDAENIEDLMKNADTAMYDAKAAGGGSYRFFSEELNKIITKQLQIETELRQALQNNILELYYQPQVDTVTGELVGTEALLRWNHPQNGVTMPTSFIPLAEESRLIVDIDLWVINAVCMQLKAWQLVDRPPVIVAINLSARFFQEEGIVSRLVNLIEFHDVDRNNIELEITEGTLIEDMDKTLVTLEKLKELGFKLTIDDFGTGYSSLSYLKLLPIQKLKIDQSFIDKCISNPVDAALVKTIINMAHNMNMKCIAEGVETREQLDFLRALGCDEIQGHYFSPALVVQDFQAKYLPMEKQAEAEQKYSSS